MCTHTHTHTHTHTALQLAKPGEGSMAEGLGHHLTSSSLAPSMFSECLSLPSPQQTMYIYIFLKIKIVVQYYLIQVYYIMISHLHTLQNDHDKSSDHLSLHKLITILFTLSLILIIISPWLSYFITRSLYLLIRFT